MQEKFWKAWNSLMEELLKMYVDSKIDGFVLKQKNNMLQVLMVYSNMLK